MREKCWKYSMPKKYRLISICIVPYCIFVFVSKNAVLGKNTDKFTDKNGRCSLLYFAPAVDHVFQLGDRTAGHGFGHMPVPLHDHWGVGVAEPVLHGFEVDALLDE